MRTCCVCRDCEIASCSERADYDYYDDVGVDFNEEKEYEKAQDYAWFLRHGHEPAWAK